MKEDNDGENGVIRRWKLAPLCLSHKGRCRPADRQNIPPPMHTHRLGCCPTGRMQRRRGPTWFSCFVASRTLDELPSLHMKLPTRTLSTVVCICAILQASSVFLISLYVNGGLVGIQWDDSSQNQHACRHLVDTCWFRRSGRHLSGGTRSGSGRPHRCDGDLDPEGEFYSRGACTARGRLLFGCTGRADHAHAADC